MHNAVKNIAPIICPSEIHTRATAALEKEVAEEIKAAETNEELSEEQLAQFAVAKKTRKSK